MKAYLLVVALAVIPACGKKNDVAVLQHEAADLAKYYQPELEGFAKRVDAIMKRDLKLPADFPGLQEAGARLREASETLQQLQGIVGKGPDGKSAVENQAATAAKAGKVEDLEKLVHDTEEVLDRGITVINGDLDAVESWLALYDRKLLAAQASPAAQASAAGSEPNAPDAQPAQATEQPSGTAPKTEPPKAEPPKAEPPKTEQPKAAQPKAETSKQPAPAQPKQPAPAQPKQAAPAQPKQPAPAQPKP